MKRIFRKVIASLSEFAGKTEATFSAIENERLGSVSKRELSENNYEIDYTIT